MKVRTNTWMGLLVGWVFSIVVCQIDGLLGEEVARNMGLSGRVEVELDRPDYRVIKQDDATSMLLQVEKVEKLEGGKYRYEIIYMGMEPGTYPVKDWLESPDGAGMTAGEQVIEVRDGLAEGHDGSLPGLAPQRMPWMGSYRGIMIGLFVAWVAMLVGILRAYRKKPEMVEVVEQEPDLSIEEQLRPLVEKAAGGAMTVEEQSQFERLMMRYWRDALGLNGLTVPEALAMIKRDPEAGRLIVAVEKWLHSQEGAAVGEVESLLEDYRKSGQEQVREEGSL